MNTNRSKTNELSFFNPSSSHHSNFFSLMSDRAGGRPLSQEVSSCKTSLQALTRSDLFYCGHVPLIGWTSWHAPQPSSSEGVDVRATSRISGGGDGRTKGFHSRCCHLGHLCTFVDWEDLIVSN